MQGQAATGKVDGVGLVPGFGSYRCCCCWRESDLSIHPWQLENSIKSKMLVRFFFFIFNFAHFNLMSHIMHRHVKRKKVRGVFNSQLIILHELGFSGPDFQVNEDY